MKRVSHKDYTDEYYQFHLKYTETGSNIVKSRNELVFNLVSPKKSDFVLDMGCGIGTFTAECAKRGTYTIGFDFSENATKIAKRRITRLNVGENSEIIRGDISHLPFKSDFFDLIIAADFVEHLYDDQYEKAIEEWYRVFKKGGTAVVLTPNPECLMEKYLSLQNFFLFIKRDIREHVSKFGYLHVSLKPIKYLANTLEGAGFKISHISYYPITSNRLIVRIVDLIPEWLKKRVQILFYQQMSLLAKK